MEVSENGFERVAYSSLQIDLRYAGMDEDDEDGPGGRYYARKREMDSKRPNSEQQGLTFHLLGSNLSTRHFVFTFRFPMACWKARGASSHLEIEAGR